MSAFWTNLLSFARTYEKPFTVAVIIVVALVLRLVLTFVVNRVVKRIVNGVQKRQGKERSRTLVVSPLTAVRVVQRTRTLGLVFNNVINALIIIVSVLLIINELFPNITGAFSLITAALGAGLGFGAQGIVKDVLNGLSMVAEDQLGVGDIVDLGPATGVVESVGIRTTQIRDVTGTVWFVHNGDISRVGNQSLGWSRVIIDLAVPYTSDVAAVQKTMLETATELGEVAKFRPLVLEKPEIWGVEALSGDAIVIRLVVKTRAGSKDEVARELRSRLKTALDKLGVTLPPVNAIVLSGLESHAAKTDPSAAE